MQAGLPMALLPLPRTATSLTTMTSEIGCVIRSAEPADAASLLELKQVLDPETEFMMLEPGERQEAPEQVARHLEFVGRHPGSTVLVAEEGGRLLGYVEAEGGAFRRNRHAAYVVIGVRHAAAGRGIGAALLRGLDDWARNHGVHRLELTVMAHNERAIALYRRCGYEIEGIRRHSLRVGQVYVDELALAKLP